MPFAGIPSHVTTGNDFVAHWTTVDADRADNTLQWPGMTITGDIDEVKLRDAQGNDVAVGERDPELPDPGP